jgi:hypothetical protein
MSTWRSSLAAVLAFCALAAVVTYPQVDRLGSAVADHTDPLFSVWRLAWVAHQLRTNPAHVFDANIFYPEPSTFAYSDAMLLPAVAVAPLFWLHVNPIATYNLALLGALAISGFTMFLLCRTLTGDALASFAGGVVFAFAPYRFEQYVHLEMQMVLWIPVALLAAHRLIAGRRVRDGILLGVVIAAQTLSGIYSAMYFVVGLAVLMPALVLATTMRKPLRLAMPLAVGALLAAVILLPYALPYSRVSHLAGPRSIGEIQHYGASLTRYLAAPASNRLYGWTSARFGADELQLFPGIVAVALGLAALVRRPSRVALAYLALLLFAIEAARGFDGVIYPLLYRYIPPIQGLRVPARFDLIVNLALGVLAAFGLQRLASRLPRPWRAAGAAIVIAAMTAEYASAPALAAVARPSLADRWLATRPPGVLVELPLPTVSAMWPSAESRYMYEGTVHWLPMVNGYSGFFPPSYVELLSAMESFPDERSLALLRQRNVRYILLRTAAYGERELADLRGRLEAAPGVSLLAGLPAPHDDLIYGLDR